jgi:hypothetical protein
MTYEDNIKTAFLLPVQISFDLFLRIAFLDAFPLIVLLFTLAQTDLQLGIAIFIKENTQRDDRISLLLDLIFQLAQFPAGKQQLAVMDSKMVVGRAEPVFGNMHISYPQLSLEENAEAIHKIHLPVPDRLHLRSCQYHARIEFVFDEIIVISGPVLYFLRFWDNLKFIHYIILLLLIKKAKPIAPFMLYQGNSFLDNFPGIGKGID